jgi:transketolase
MISDMGDQLKMNGENVFWKEEIQQTADRIRLRVMEHTLKNGGGYLSQACSSAEIVASLYMKILNLGKTAQPIAPGPFPGVPGPHNPHYFRGADFNGPRGARYDRFILSPAQYALVVYAALIEVGRMTPGGLDDFNKDGGVVEMIGAEHSPGMEVMTGSLGQGISQAAGIAMARRLKGETGRVVLLLSDGECQSGQFWEAVQAMSFHRLDNMLAYVDLNGFQCDGRIASIMSIEPIDERLKSFGARVFRTDGHDIETLCSLGLREPDGRPTFILCDTDSCRGIGVLKDRMPKLHYIRFKSEGEKNEYRLAYERMKKGRAPASC